MTDLERAALLDIVAATPGRLKAALKGVSKKLLLWAPGPGKWSILEIVAHMRDMEHEAYLVRYRRILAEDNPALPDIDGDALAIKKDYRSLKLPELTRDWLKARKECLKLLRSVKGARWERRGMHETAGPLTLEALLRRHAVANDEAHLGQIEGIRKRAAAFEVLESASKRLAGLTRRLDHAVLRRKPAPDRWSALEVVCHLRDVERLWVNRIVKAAFDDRPLFFMVDFEALAREHNYNGQDLGASLKEFARLREDTLRVLRALPAGKWKRVGLHPRRGEISIERMVETMMSHDSGHLDQIQKAVAAA
jgi:uncharacterized damage-inducible protein DinB